MIERYRIRRGWFGKCILQQWQLVLNGDEYSRPSWQWVDVKFHHAPIFFLEFTRENRKLRPQAPTALKKGKRK